VERPSAEELGVQLVDSERSGRKSQYDLVELAMQIQKAEEFTKSSACSKLQVIAEQVKFLHDQARKILEDAKQGENLHHLACNFKKIPGNVYYLYQRPSGQKYFSIISPEVIIIVFKNVFLLLKYTFRLINMCVCVYCQEWGSSCPHTFLASYRLETDMSWTQASKIEQKDRELHVINQILSGTKSLSAAIEPAPVDNNVTYQSIKQ